MAEELALEQRLGHRGAIDRDEGPPHALAALVDGARDELLAGAGLAGDEDRHVGVRDARDEVVDARHRARAADDLLGRRDAPDLLAEAPHLARQRAVSERARERDLQLLDVEGLGDEVVRARADRADRRLEAAERGDHDHRDIGEDLGEALAERDAVEATHVEVGDDGIDALVRGQQVERVAAVRRVPHREAALAEGAPQHLAHARVVLDHQHTARRHIRHADLAAARLRPSRL